MIFDSVVLVFRAAIIDDGLKDGAIAGIVVGIVVLVIVAAIIIAFVCRQRRKSIEKAKEYELRMIGPGILMLKVFTLLSTFL